MDKALRTALSRRPAFTSATAMAYSACSRSESCPKSFSLCWIFQAVSTASGPQAPRGQEFRYESYQADPATGDVPVVVISADATEHHSARLLEAGATAYITKPFDVASFVELVNRLTGPESEET